MIQSENSREPTSKSKGTFYERHGYLLLYRLDRLVDDGDLDEERAIKLSKMSCSQDPEIVRLAETIIHSILEKYFLENHKTVSVGHDRLMQDKGLIPRPKMRV